MTLPSTERRDREFLAKLATATLEELHVIVRNHASKKAPPWKKIAIERAIAKATQHKGTGDCEV